MDKTETKIVYCYDSNGLYTGQKTLDYTDRSPISGTWQLPANTTETTPPKAKDGYNRVWNGTAWGYEEISTSNEEEEELTLNDAKTAKLLSLSSLAATAYTSGFSSSATGSVLWYDSDTNTQHDITDAVLLAIASTEQFSTLYPSGIIIRAKASRDAEDCTKVKYIHTATQVITLGTDMRTMLSAIKTKVWEYQEQIYACMTVKEVEAITMSF
ncbi:MAG: hypothetical protein H6Q72_4899 [Firmicutes bacterium]|nr:hypothetical protein [Bacillota bacterium]